MANVPETQTPGNKNSIIVIAKPFSKVTVGAPWILEEASSSRGKWVVGIVIILAILIILYGIYTHDWRPLEKILAVVDSITKVVEKLPSG